jgi:hypothetical protein
VKTIEQHFCDWETSAFGYGYGTGEQHVLGALKAFFAAIPEGPYDYRDLEAAVTPAVAWLLINTLALDDKIEYGTSPRFGWLTETGLAVSKFVATRTVEELVSVTGGDTDYIHCYPNYCNCDDGDCRPHNPFWEAVST